eukprot:351328-Chlamydomonas_euryale.AAC.6
MRARALRCPPGTPACAAPPRAAGPDRGCHGKCRGCRSRTSPPPRRCHERTMFPSDGDRFAPEFRLVAGGRRCRIRWLQAVGIGVPCPACRTLFVSRDGRTCKHVKASTRHARARHACMGAHGYSCPHAY